MSAQSYRPDIDGLRSIAILSVLAFHLSPELFAGGFLGVDVFFVISGYLITTSLLHQGYGGFYVRRVNRLFPALVVVVLLTILVGAWTLLPDEFRILGKHVRASAAFLQNFNLSAESGYFDRSSEAKPLLHLWSLAVEEQFYLLWPLLLIPANKRRFALPLAVTLALLYLGYADWLTSHGHADAAFYRFGSRAWEPLVGCALALWAHRRGHPESTKAGNAWALAGLAATVGAIALLTEHSAHMPGLAALPAVLGAAAIIHGGATQGPVSRALGHAIPRYIGKISYPLYLVHWPVIAYKNIMLGHTNSAAVLGVCLLLSVLLAMAVYHWVELPVQRMVKQHRRGTYALAGAMFGFVLIGSAMHAKVWRAPAVPPAVDAQLNSMVLGRHKGDTSAQCLGLHREEQLTPYCASEQRWPVRQVVWGDSKADAIYWGLVANSSANTGGWALLGLFSCAPMVGVERTLPHRDISAERCNKANRQALEAIRGDAHIQTVLIATASRILARSDYRLLGAPVPAPDAAQIGLTHAIQALQNSGKRVLLLEDNPTIVDPTFCVSRSAMLPLATALIDRTLEVECSKSLPTVQALTRPYRAMLNEVAAATGATIVPTEDLNCDAQAQRCEVRRAGQLRYSYGDHYSDDGALPVAQRIHGLLQAAPADADQQHAHLKATAP